MTTDIIRLQYPGSCSACGTALLAGTKAHWSKATRAITCLTCDPTAEDSRPLATHPTSSPPEQSTLVRPESGRAGASGQAQYERLRQKREAELDQRFGRFAGLVKFLIDNPQSTRAWDQGSVGERLLGEALTRRVGDRAVLLHDRKAPRSSANIDHLAIAASGVWVIDAKKYKGRVQRRDKGGWRTTDYHVYVDGRDRTALTQGLHKQATVVRAALGDLDVPIYSVLCFVDVEWDLFLKPFQIAGVWVTYAKHLAEMIGAAGPLTEDDVLATAHALAVALPPKVA